MRPVEAETFTVQIKRSESILIVDINTEVRSDCLANNQTACQELTPSEFLPSRRTDSEQVFSQFYIQERTVQTILSRDVNELDTDGYY